MNKQIIKIYLNFPLSYCKESVKFKYWKLKMAIEILILVTQITINYNTSLVISSDTIRNNWYSIQHQRTKNTISKLILIF